MKLNLLEIYRILLSEFDFRNWWPGNTKNEIIIGAILVQNVSWRNAKIAINNLKKKSADIRKIAFC